MFCSTKLRKRATKVARDRDPDKTDLENLHTWLYFTLCLTVGTHATICKRVSQNVWDLKRLFIKRNLKPVLLTINNITSRYFL